MTPAIRELAARYIAAVAERDAEPLETNVSGGKRQSLRALDLNTEVTRLAHELARAVAEATGAVRAGGVAK